MASAATLGYQSAFTVPAVHRDSSDPSNTSTSQYWSTNNTHQPGSSTGSSASSSSNLNDSHLVRPSATNSSYLSQVSVAVN